MRSTELFGEISADIRLIENCKQVSKCVARKMLRNIYQPNQMSWKRPVFNAVNPRAWSRKLVNFPGEQTSKTAGAKLRQDSLDFCHGSSATSNSSQIVVFFGFFNRPGSSATSNNSASTSDNGDKISSQCPMGFLSGLPISSQMSKGFLSGLPPGYDPPRKKNESFVSFQFRKYLPKICQFIGQNPVKSEQS